MIYPGAIVQVNASDSNQTYDILYDDGDQDKQVPARRIRPLLSSHSGSGDVNRQHSRAAMIASHTIGNSSDNAPNSIERDANLGGAAAVSGHTGMVCLLNITVHCELLYFIVNNVSLFRCNVAAVTTSDKYRSRLTRATTISWAVVNGSVADTPGTPRTVKASETTVVVKVIIAGVIVLIIPILICLEAMRAEKVTGFNRLGRDWDWGLGQDLDLEVSIEFELLPAINHIDDQTIVTTVITTVITITTTIATAVLQIYLRGVSAMH